MVTRNNPDPIINIVTKSGAWVQQKYNLLDLVPGFQPAKIKQVGLLNHAVLPNSCEANSNVTLELAKNAYAYASFEK